MLFRVSAGGRTGQVYTRVLGVRRCDKVCAACTAAVYLDAGAKRTGHNNVLDAGTGQLIFKFLPHSGDCESVKRHRMVPGRIFGAV